ncbi:MAG: alkaline phosphatase D family protein [Halieaceae bacterium]|nr:alkaline phosphatase D family protein [Halieaceae bacterium]
MPLESIKRRTLVKGLSATLGVLALRGFSVHAENPVHFTHGIASGDPLQDRVILWTRVIPGHGVHQQLKVDWQIASDAKFRKIVNQGDTQTNSDRDYTVKVDATGLKAGKQYYYRFNCEGVSSIVGNTKTLPKGRVREFKMGVASCSNYPQGYFNAYKDMAAADLDVVLHLGDYIYEYADGVYSNPIAVEQLGRRVQPSTEIIALEDYRMRYGLYRTDADLQALHQNHPMIHVWDDHELTNNTWHSGAENHNEGEGDFATRMAAAKKAYHEWMPIRTRESDQETIYRSFEIGNLADLIMLDTRLIGRDEQLEYGKDLGDDPSTFAETKLNKPERELLGKPQAEWLRSELQKSKTRGATWQVLGQQVLMGKVLIPTIDPAVVDEAPIPDSYKQRMKGMLNLAKLGLPLNLDAWDGYPAARERLYDDLLEYGVNPISLAGDTHNAWAFNLRNSQGDAVGIELGTPGISSPGLESFLPLPIETTQQSFLSSSPELVEADTSQRGWAMLTLTPSGAETQFRYVSTVLSREFSVTSSAPLRAPIGKRRFDQG